MVYLYLSEKSIEPIIEDCREIMCYFEECSVWHISRLRNSVAHKLDGLSKQFGSRIWVGNVPSHIQPFIVTMFRFSTVNQNRFQSHILSSILGLKTSIIWRSITKAIKHMMDGLSVHLGSGNSSFWFKDTRRIYTCLSFR